MTRDPWFVRISPFVLLLFSGCMSEARFAVCGNGVMEPTEECTPNWNSTSKAVDWCTGHGYAGGSATCRETDCTWDTSTCTGNDNNVNNLDTGCDPFTGTGCPAGEDACYMFYDTLWLTVCLPAGPESVDCAGMEANECFPGNYCHDGECLPLCDPMHPCTGTICVPIAGGDMGVCQ
jgi:hypothetical protein